jgi:hypothetical protein
MYTQEQIAKFYSRVEAIPEAGCKVWLGAVDQCGYGKLTINSEFKRAHRVAWEMARGSIPKRMLICHRCDNPACVNIEHLFLGDQSVNMRDMHSKKRHMMRDKRWAIGLNHHGENNPRAKLTAAAVKHIRECDLSAPQLAKQYNIHRNQIYAIRKRESWRNI